MSIHTYPNDDTLSGDTIVITDSGLGGLDVASKVFERLKKIPNQSIANILFVNALPEQSKGYNTMPDDKSKASAFNQALFGIEKRFRPAKIIIACNTLSAIIQLTSYYTHNPHKLINIIDSTINYMQSKPDKFGNTQIIIFGTETTITSRLYQDRLNRIPVKEQDIIAVPCPKLASEIELDYQSDRTLRIIRDCVTQAKLKISEPADKIIALLACTHYGYTKSIFTNFFQLAGLRNVEIINPNDFLIEHVVQLVQDKYVLNTGVSPRAVEIQVVSKCNILSEEIRSISSLIEPDSPQTAQALRRYFRDDQLF
jgi:glutamate racemase